MIEEELSKGLQYWKLEQSSCTTIYDDIHVKVEDVVCLARLFFLTPTQSNLKKIL